MKFLFEMFRIEKKFTFPMGHRLSKHKGACFNFHGHNYTVLVGMASPNLNFNGMVMDFGDLKNFLKPLFDLWDHAFMINQTDEFRDKIKELGMNIIVTEGDPTAERMAKIVFDYLNENLDILRRDSNNDQLIVDYVTIYETDGAKATYSRG